MAQSNCLALGPIQRVVLLGWSEIFLDIRKWCAEQEIETRILTSPDQEANFANLPLEILSVTSLGDARVEPFVREGVDADKLVAISFGARWIITSKRSDALFNGKLLNAHGTRLPLDRGAGGFSWRILRGDRLGNLLLHVIDDGIDTGPLIRTAPYVIPPGCRTPAEISNDYVRRLHGFVLDFLSEIRSATLVFPLLYQPNYLSTYYPRLLTENHAWIDWRQTPQAIERLILAFDSPYAGAMTYWNGQKVRLGSAQLHVGEPGHHPFQAGLVLRKSEGWFVTSLSDQYALIVERFENDSGDSLIDAVEIGDRLYTPNQMLDTAYSLRVSIGPTGVRAQPKA